MKDNCFIVLHWLLPNINQFSRRFTPVPSHLNTPPSSLPIAPLCLSSLSHAANSHWLSILRMSMYISMLLSPYPPLSLSPSANCVHKSVLYVCIYIAALQKGSSVPSFLIPYVCVCVCVCVNIQKTVFLFLTSLCIISSRFIHLTQSCLTLCGP